MFAILFLFALGLTGVAAQASYGSPENSPAFTYWGCAVVDAATFSQPIVFADGIVTPTTCQAACVGDQFAALSPDGCRCGNDPSGIKSLDEKACNYPCINDPNSGMCGGICPEHGPGVSNVFTNNIILVPGDGSPSVDVPNPPPGPSHAWPSDQRASSVPATSQRQTYITSAPVITTSPGQVFPFPVSTASVSTHTSMSQVTSIPASSIPSIPTSWVSDRSISSQILPRPNATIPGGNSKNLEDPPIPTPVTESDSSSFEISVLVSFAEILLAVVIIL